MSIKDQVTQKFGGKSGGKIQPEYPKNLTNDVEYVTHVPVEMASLIVFQSGKILKNIYIYLLKSLELNK